MNAPRRTASQRLAAGPTPEPTPVPTAAPVDAIVGNPPFSPPAKLSKLQAAMNKVSDSLTAIQKLGADIDELERTAGPSVVFAVATKEGYKQAEAARKKARQSRLDVQRMKKEATDLLNGLKTETWGVTDPVIARLDAIETNAKTQIEAEDRKEQDRKERHEQAIDAITVFAIAPPSTSAEIRERLNSVNAIIVDDSYEEFMERATKVQQEVRASLTHALDVALRDEQAERERQEREAATTALRAKIAAMKALPSQLEGTDLANVREALRIHKANVPTAEEFGDLIDFAEAVHFKATKEIEELEAMLGMAQEHEQEEAEPEFPPSPLLTPAPTPAPDMEPVDLLPNAERSEQIVAEVIVPVLSGNLIVRGVPTIDPDPFTAPLRPAARPVARPVGQVIPGPSSPDEPLTASVTEVHVADPRTAMDIVEAEVPDLLAAARAVLPLWDALTRGEAVVPLLDAKMRDLRAAVDFNSEFC